MRAASFLAACAFSLAPAVHAQAPRDWRVNVAGDAIVFAGRIERDSVDEFLRVLRERPDITRLVITSGGGQVITALEMGEAVHARRLDIDVPVACLSSCANYIFPAGKRKRLGHPLAVGWHGNMTHVLYMQLTGEANYSEEKMQSARWLVRREAEFFPRIGVDGFVCWFAKLAPYNAPNYFTVSAADMARFGITGVEILRGPSPAPDEDTPVLVTPDFQRLEHTRPALPLEP